MPTFKGIVCLGKNRVIGKGDTMPWYHPEDLKFFKKTTLDGHIIMGRKTYESLPQGYLNRRTIWVLTKKNTYGWLQMDYNYNKDRRYAVNMVESLDHLPELNYWVCGGLSVYQLLMPKIDEFFVTYLNQEYDGDVILPPFEDVFTKGDTVMTSSAFEIKRLYERKAEKSSV